MFITTSPTPLAAAATPVSHHHTTTIHASNRLLHPSDSITTTTINSACFSNSLFFVSQENDDHTTALNRADIKSRFLITYTWPKGICRPTVAGLCQSALYTYMCRCITNTNLKSQICHVLMVNKPYKPQTIYHDVHQHHLPEHSETLYVRRRGLVVKNKYGETVVRWL